eukprot:4338739-Pyramimonas_sp.AAC.1
MPLEDPMPPEHSRKPLSVFFEGTLSPSTAPWGKSHPKDTMWALTSPARIPRRFPEATSDAPIGTENHRLIWSKVDPELLGKTACKSCAAPSKTSSTASGSPRQLPASSSMCDASSTVG